MTDVLQVKEEPTSVVRESRLPNLPSGLTEDVNLRSPVTLEQVANNPEKLRRFELLDRYLLQLTKGEYLGSFDVVKDSNYLRKLVRSDDTHVQIKVSELLLQYFKSMKLNTQYDTNLGGIQDSMLLLKLYQVVHDDCCYYLLPNSKAGETFNKFLCNLLSTASSEYVFTSVVRLFQRTLENVLSKYNNVHSPSVSRDMSTEDTRVVIGVMKTLLTLTRAFGSPPAPRDVLCSLSVVVINSTNAHTCRVYSYNVAAFLIKDVVDEETRRKLLKGLNEVQYNQVVALVKECNSLNNTCNWKFKYCPPDLVSSSSSQVQAESSLSVPSTSTNTATTNNTVEAGVSVTNTVDTNNTTSSYVDNSNRGSNSNSSTNYSSVSSLSNSRSVVDSKKQKEDVVSVLPNNWYKELFNTFESNRGEGKNVVVDKNAWKWKNDALLNTLKKLENVSSVELDSVSTQFSTLFESLFKYESAIPVVINSLNLFTVLTVKGNCDFLSVGKSQLLSDMLFEKLKENNKKVRDACVQSLVEVVKRSKLSVVSDSVKRALVNVSPTCRENMCNFLNGKLLTTSDSEFYEKLQQLLLLLSEYLKQLTSEKVPKVKQAVLSVLDVLDNFNLVYSNQSTYSSTSTNSNSSLYSNMSNTSNTEEYSVTREKDNNLATSTSTTREQERTATSTTTNSNTVDNSNRDAVNQSSLTNTTTSNNQDFEYTMTTTATSFVHLDSSTEFSLESAEKNTSFVDVETVVRPRGPMSVENLVDVVDSEVLDRFRVVENKSLDEALYNLCLWMTDNTRLVKSVDFYLLKLMSEFYSSFSNKLTVDMFFSTMFSQALSDDAFSEVLEFLKKKQDLKVLNTLLSKNNTNTNRLLNPLNNLYYSQRTSNLVDSNRNTSVSSRNASSVDYQNSSLNVNQSSSSSSSSNATVDKVLVSLLELLSKFVSDESYVVVDEVVVKLVNFLAYFVKVKSESCYKVALDLLWSVNERYEVYKYLDDELVASVTYSKPSKSVTSAYLSSATRFEKYISKDLFMIMFQSNEDYKRRASYYWKGFIGDKTAKSRDMLEGKGRKDLTSWLSYCLFENMCHKYVVAGLDLMTDYLLSKGLQFDAEESLLLTESLCSYGTFGRYQAKAMSVYHKMTKCLSYSLETLQFMFEFVEKASAQWATVVSKALFMMLESAKKDNDKELLSYVSKRLEMSSKMSNYYKNKLRQWVESFVSKEVSESKSKETALVSASVPDSYSSSDTNSQSQSQLNSLLASSSYPVVNQSSLTNTTTSNNSSSKVVESSDNQVHSITTSSSLVSGSVASTSSGLLASVTYSKPSKSPKQSGVEPDEQLAATSLSEDSLRSKYSRDTNNSSYLDNRDKECYYNKEVVNDTKDYDKDKDKGRSSREHVDKEAKVDRVDSSVKQDLREQVDSSNVQEDLEDVKNRDSKDDSNKDTSKEQERNTTSTTTSSNNVDSVSTCKVAQSTSRLVMETLDTVHQDDYHNMEPVSTTDSNYESKTNFPSSDFSYLSQQQTYRDTTEEPQQVSVDTNNSSFVDTSNLNQDKESFNESVDVQSSLSPEVFYESKNKRLADREVVEDKGVNLVGQVLLEDDVNVDMDLESCRRLSQQILDTPTSRVVEVSSKRKSKDQYSQTENNWEDDNFRNQKRSCTDVGVQQTFDNSLLENTDDTNNTTSSYVDNSNRDRDKDWNKEKENKDKAALDNRDTKDVSNKFSREHVDKEVGTESYGSRYDKQTEMSTVRSYDKDTSANLLETQVRSENWNERDVDVDLSSNYYREKIYLDNMSNTSNTICSDRSKELGTESYGSRYDKQIVDESKLQKKLKNKKVLATNTSSNTNSNTLEVGVSVSNTVDNSNSNRDAVDQSNNNSGNNTNKSSGSSNTSSNSKDTYPSVVVEFDSDSDFVSGEVYGLNLVETVLSHCSRVNNACLVSSYKEYQKLADTLCPGNFSKTCVESCSQVLKYKNILKGSLLRLLSSPLVEMCHNAVLLLSKKLIKKVQAREQYDQTLEALTSTVEVFKLVTSNLQDKFVLQFCNVVTNLLSLPKDLFQNERLYCLVSELVSDNALKQSTEVMYKLLVVMVELSMESLEGDLDRLLMAKLRFTKILQMQILLTLKNNGSENVLDSVALKSKHVNFIRRLETFANRRTAHNVEKVIQTSNYLISTI